MSTTDLESLLSSIAGSDHSTVMVEYQSDHPKRERVTLATVPSSVLGKDDMSKMVILTGKSAIAALESAFPQLCKNEESCSRLQEVFSQVLKGKDWTVTGTSNGTKPYKANQANRTEEMVSRLTAHTNSLKSAVESAGWLTFQCESADEYPWYKAFTNAITAAVSN